MKKHLVFLAPVILGLTLVAARAQPGPPPVPNFEGDMGKLFGVNSGFSADLEIDSTRPSGQELEIAARILHAEGKARIQMDLSNIRGTRMPPQTAARMKEMGLGQQTMIIRRDQSLSYAVYPELKAYLETATHEKYAPLSEYKIEVTKLGRETIDGHDCVKNKVVVTDPDGLPHESTVWNATDLKDFPVKIQKTSSVNDNALVILFKNVKLETPDDSQFQPPPDFKKYNDMMSLMMSRARGGSPR